MMNLNVNGKTHTVDVEPETPLLWVLRDTLGLTGTKYGCGAACGACTVHVDGEPMRSCVVPLGGMAGKKIATIEGLRADGAAPRAAGVDRARGAAMRLLPDRADHGGGGAAGKKPQADRCATSTRHDQPLPLRHLHPHARGDPRAAR